MKKLNIAIIIVSNTRTARTDKSGNLLKKLIISDGHKVFDKIINLYLQFHRYLFYLMKLL